jgi:hypothetical protein
MSKLFLIMILFLRRINSFQNITCGKKPTDSTKCSKYGTDSGFLCCYVKDKDASPKCQLMSYKLAEIMEIKGKKTIENGTYYSCGNSSSFIKITLFSLIFIFLLF